MKTEEASGATPEASFRAPNMNSSGEQAFGEIACPSLEFHDRIPMLDERGNDTTMLFLLFLGDLTLATKSLTVTNPKGSCQQWPSAR
jgi:hypothetical protein